MRYHPGNLRNSDSVVESLRNLSVKAPSAQLRTSLRVLASRERQRRLERQNFRTLWNSWQDRTQLFFDNVIRSVALPFAGGVCSTLVLFSMFVVPAYPLLTRGVADVPTVLSTPVSVKHIAPFSVGDTDVVVDVVVDEQGRMLDYAVVAGSSVLANPQMRRRLENAIEFSNFTPATTFGQPMVSKMRLWFRSSRIDVRG
jgi:predicted thioesterase